MSILEKIDADFNRAFREKNESVVLTLRQIKAVLTNAEIAKKRQALTEDEIIKSLKSEVKKRKEAIELYQRGGRPELAAREQKEIEVISQYLPAELSEEKIREVIKAVIAKNNITDVSHIGKLMGLLMGELKGQADGNLVKKIAEELLSVKP